jgi:carbon-monoxide dehydrogenase large subunit
MEEIRAHEWAGDARRSGGEGGTTPALAAVINAIVDALAELGVRHIEMPATPERVWHAIRAEGSTAAATS